MLAYPKEFPITSITSIISSFKAGTAKDHIPRIAQELWELQGYCQAQILGSDPTASATLTAQAVQEFDGIAVLEKLAADHQAGVVTAQSAIDWTSLVIWAIQEALKLWQQHHGNK